MLFAPCHLEQGFVVGYGGRCAAEFRGHPFANLNFADCRICSFRWSRALSNGFGRVDLRTHHGDRRGGSAIRSKRSTSAKAGCFTRCGHPGHVSREAGNARQGQ